MLRVSLSEVKPLLSKSAKKQKNIAKNTIQTKKIADVKKVMPKMIMLGNGAILVSALEKSKTKPEPCSDFCMEVTG